MGNFIQINRIEYATPPSVNQIVIIKHRLTSAPDVPSSYSIDSSNVEVDVFGYLIPPFMITGLILGQSYTVVITNYCNGSSVSQEYVVSDCPDANVITGTTGGGNPYW